MTETYRITKDEENKESLEITETTENKKVINKESIVLEIARLQTLLNKFIL
jgi:hypothetical protein